MMQPLVRWMRVVLPEGAILAVAVAGVVLIDTINLLSSLGGRLPDPEVAANFRMVLLALCSLAFGIWRVAAFHPALNVDYRRWLELSPWTPGRSLPAGPLWLVPQDLVVMGILGGLYHEISPKLLILPVVFLASYLVNMAAINRLIGQWALAYVVAFGLAAIPLVHTHLEYILAIELACYLPTLWGIHRGLRSFPWKLPELMEGRSFKVAAEAIKERRLGWPYDVLQLTEPKLRIPLSDGLCISFLAGWLELTMLVAIPGPAHIVVMGGSVQVMFTTLIPVIVAYLENHRSPINAWGRIFTFRWIIRDYDRVWLIPLIAAVLGVMGQFALPLYWNCLSLTGFLLVILVVGPHLEKWRLTGKQRLTFGWNPSVTAAKDFIEI